MNCVFCSGSSKVVDSRPIAGGIRRRRECLLCGRRFTTHEKAVPLELRVIKSGTRPPEDFAPGKIAVVLQKVLKGRPVDEHQITDMIRRIEAELTSSGQTTISSQELARLVAELLNEHDKIAWTRFVTNYLDIAGQLSFGAQKMRPQRRRSQLELFSDSRDPE
jgi:transcriptional repressor NrdR